MCLNIIVIIKTKVFVLRLTNHHMSRETFPFFVYPNQTNESSPKIMLNDK